jgi:hypothetical protein
MRDTVEYLGQHLWIAGCASSRRLFVTSQTLSAKRIWTQTMSDKPTLGWREWLALPDLGINAIKAKIDTGARTSALHAYYVEPFSRGGDAWVRFGMHPQQGSNDEAVHCEAQVLDRRPVTDSGGHREERYVIRTLLALGEHRVPAEVTLTDRENMRFRMLLGRTAMRGHFHVDPGRSYLQGARPGRKP